MPALLSPDQRSRFARSAGALLAMPAICAAVEAEVEATFAEHPALPQTAQARCVLWGLAFPHLSQSALTSSAAQTQTQTQQKHA